MKTMACMGLMAAVWLAQSAAMAQWSPKKDHILSRWAEQVSPEAPLPEYPRPGLVRGQWLNLNGLWDYSVQPKPHDRFGKPQGQILVPFCIESALSGVGGRVAPNQRLWYHRTFTVPEAWSGQRVMLHFGAVDWETIVRVNGHEVGRHVGGYDAFSFDITGALKPGGEQELVLAVWDPTDAGDQPRGKQVLEPEGIWYTAVTGIWQTVWMEPVPETAIERLKLSPDIDAGQLKIEAAQANAHEGDTLAAQALDGGAVVAEAEGPAAQALTLAIANAKLWSPDSPFLYDLKVTLKRNGQVVDEVGSYFGMRKIALGKDDKGLLRLCLNNQPLFQLGPLDQGWWPDGLYTAPTDEALRYDVEATRAMGFNMARKHVKVEPARWYYHCDKLGLMVWQDMPSGDRFIGRNDADITRGSESETQYFAEFNAIITGLHNHPSIVMWVPFNEGWGQFKTAEVTQWTKAQDPSRLINPTSGWADRQAGDVYDKHEYPGPGMFPVEDTRASVLGEFGGLGWPVEGHLWVQDKNWGYRSFETRDDLRNAYAGLILRLRTLIPEGLAAAVYTQTTDVEVEVNGLMTYDRADTKMGQDWLAGVNAKVYQAPPKMSVLAPTSEKEPVQWRYTENKPGPGWEDAVFDDSAWKEGPGVLGAKGARNAVVRTEWTTNDIWVRRAFELTKKPEGMVALTLHHNLSAEVFINDVPAAKEEDYTTGYGVFPLPDKAMDALCAGKNVLSIHCRNTNGGQCVDAGLVEFSDQ